MIRPIRDVVDTRYPALYGAQASTSTERWVELLISLLERSIWFIAIPPPSRPARMGAKRAAPGGAIGSPGLTMAEGGIACETAEHDSTDSRFMNYEVVFYSLLFLTPRKQAGPSRPFRRSLSPPVKARWDEHLSSQLLTGSSGGRACGARGVDVHSVPVPARIRGDRREGDLVEVRLRSNLV